MVMKSRRRRGKKFKIYIPLDIRELNPRESEVYWRSHYKVGNPDAIKAMVKRTRRAVYGLRHPKLSGIIYFSCIRKDLPMVLSKVIGAVDGRLIDADIAKAGFDFDDVEESILSEEDSQALQSIFVDLVLGPEIENEPVKEKKKAWTPFGCLDDKK